MTESPPGAAQTPDLPTFALDAPTQSILSPSQETEILSALDHTGCLLLKHVFAPDFLQALHDVLLFQYQRYLREATDHQDLHKDALRVGHLRWMLPIKMHAPFLDPTLYAHPILLQLAQSLLGEETLLGGFGAVVSLPGARDQHEHRDLPPLFGDHPVDRQMPCFALNILIPLIDFDLHHGTTQLRLGSHRVPQAQAPDTPAVSPIAPLGSCLLLDYRLRHGGTANHSQHPRPLLYLVYIRPWFRDYRNFKKLPPLQMSRWAYRSIPPAHQHLFATTKQTWW